MRGQTTPRDRRLAVARRSAARCREPRAARRARVRSRARSDRRVRERPAAPARTAASTPSGTRSSRARAAGSPRCWPCGAGAALSHRSAAALWGIRPTAAAEDRRHRSPTSGVRSTKAIVVHRPRRPVEADDRTTASRVTTPGQTLADLAIALPRRALEKAGRASPRRLRLDVTVPAGHPGAQRLADAAAARPRHHHRQPARGRVSSSCATPHGIPRPLVQPVVEGYQVDFCWPRRRADRRDRRLPSTGRRRARRSGAIGRATRPLTARGWQVRALHRAAGRRARAPARRSRGGRCYAPRAE